MHATAVSTTSLDENQLALEDLAADLFPLLEEGGVVAFADPLFVREKIFAFERAMLNQTDAKIKIETTHTFTNGLYARAVNLPKYAIATGQIHRKECFCIMSKGEMLVLTEEGARRIKAPYAFVSKPGVKRVVIAYEDSVWTTIHATPLKDLKQIERELFAESYDEEFPETDMTTFVTMEGR